MNPFATMLRSLIREGDLTIIDAKGVARHFGNGSGRRLVVRLHRRKLDFTLVLDPELGAAEAFMDGTLTMEEGEIYDLIDIVVRNARWHRDNALGNSISRGARIFAFFQQFNPGWLSRRHVAHHYDLSDRLFDLFLDSDRQYSCAYFREPTASLEQAQADKKAHIAAKLRLDQPRPDGTPLHILDVGCGWGGMALYLNRLTGAHVTGITLSAEQLQVARQRAATAGVADQVRFELLDYRAVSGKFDRIVSVGMFEHVGKPYFRTFFDKMCTLLADDGVMLLHTIGRADGPGTTSAFTRKYIFPGGYTPALSEFAPAIEKAQLYITDLEVLRLHYAHTLDHWYARTRDAKAAIVALYDERFWRMWLFYLAGAVAAFRYTGHVVFQVQLARCVDSVPITRDYMLAAETALHQQVAQAPR